MPTIDKPEASSIASDIDKTPLTLAEAQALSEYEQIIRAGLETFVEVGNALYKIANQRLYRTTHATFELYCRDKWKFTARHANRLMLAAAVGENLASDQMVSSQPIALPANEAQARALAGLKPDQQIKAAQAVAKKPGKHTTKDFEDARKEVEEKPRITQPTQTKTKTLTGKPGLEQLIELIDEVQTWVRAGKPKEAVLTKLKAVADLATRINNGGVK